MSTIFNEEKLMSASLNIMKGKKLLSLGGGAIGSLNAEGELRSSIGYIAIADKDNYEENNIPKSSYLIRYPEDMGKPKASSLAKRANALANDNCMVNGYDIDIYYLGPLAFAGFDYCAAAVDNLAIKVYIAEQIKLCPKDKRPILLSCGSNGEYSEAMMFSETGACLRCTIPSKWLKDENPEVVYSCAAKVKYPTDKMASIVSTSGRAGSRCANDICDLIEEHALGHLSLENSIRVHRAPLHLHTSEIAPLNSCPACKLLPPDDITTIDGSTLTSTLREFLEKVGVHFNGDFVLRVRDIRLDKGDTHEHYNQFVYKERCRSCGKIFNVNKHSWQLRKKDLICDECKSSGKQATQDFDGADVKATYVFSLNDTPDAILDMKLFDLAYSIGGYYEVEEILHSNDLLTFPKTSYFVLSEDEGYLFRDPPESHKSDNK